MKRRQFLKFLGVSTLSAGLSSYTDNTDVNEKLTVFGFLSGGIQKLYNSRALALLDRDIRSATGLDNLIKKLDPKLKNDDTLIRLEGELVGTTIAYSKIFDREDASQLEIDQLSNYTSPKKAAYRKRVEDLTKFTVYQDGENFFLSTIDDIWLLTNDEIQSINDYVYNVICLEKRIIDEKNSVSLGIATTIDNYSPHLDTVYKICCQENMDIEKLLGILTIESKGNIYSVSTCGALGSWQIMPYVARLFWRKYPDTFKSNSEQELMENILRDQELSTKLAVAILKENGYPRDISIAAYNCGMDNIRYLNRYQISQIDYVRYFEMIVKGIENKEYLS